MLNIYRAFCVLTQKAIRLIQLILWRLWWHEVYRKQISVAPIDGLILYICTEFKYIEQMGGGIRYEEKKKKTVSESTT